MKTDGIITHYTSHLWDLLLKEKYDAFQLQINLRIPQMPLWNFIWGLVICQGPGERKNNL